ncbi:hypothetical protein PC120_g15417 [Phytophthora cactorum]|nr:hypothetical protein PC120_g15417 [Phytophthora cactorum]
MGSHLSLLISATMLFATVVYYYKMVLLTEMTTEASFFNTLYAEYATPQMMDSLRALEEFSLPPDITPVHVACHLHDDGLWDRKFDYDWQRLLHRAFPVDIDEGQKLFLAKTEGGAWLDGAGVAAVTVDGGGHPQGFELMDPTLWIKNPKHFGANFQPGEGQIH